ncbi:MAG: ABC transporter permease [Lachnospiraceae bacterium]|nr:ABC transporter permease [Lachnospiraceae bacterium]
MARFEFKKIFAKMSSKIALLLLLIFVAYSVCNANYLVWINEDDTELTGKTAAKKLREAENEWYGLLTDKKIEDVISQGWSQGNRGIRTLLTRAFGGLNNTDSTIVDTLSAEDAADFYSKRVSSLKEWIRAQGNWYTEQEKEFLVTQYEKMKIPLDYEYAKGWTQMFSAVSNLQMFLVLVIGFLVAGIFSEEYRTGACSIFFSTALGRGKAIRAKVKAGFFLITVVYWSTFVTFSIAVLLELGAGGSNCMIQISSQGWKSIYNITFFQEYLLIAAGGYIGCLFVDSLAMLVSAKSKSTVVSVIVPFVVLFAPSVIKIGNSRLAEKVDGLMPYQLVQMNSAICEFYLYEIFGKVVGAVGSLFILYAAVAAVLHWGIYMVFRKGEGDIYAK